MQDTRLIRLIRTFTREELKSFGKFLESPFLRPARNTIILYNYIIKFQPDFDTDKLEKRNVFKNIFPEESYNEKKILNFIFDLNKAAEDFLAYNTLMTDETELLISLSKGYLSKNLSEESNRVNKLIEKKLKPGFSRSKDYISKFRRLNSIKGIYFSEKNDFKNLFECQKEDFEASSVQFIFDYTKIISSSTPALASYGIDLKNDFINSVIQSFNFEKLLKVVEKSGFRDKHLVLLHYYLLKINLDNTNSKFYYLLRDLFYELLSELDREEKHFIFEYLINFCVQNFINPEFKKEALEVCRKMLDNNSYSNFENEYMEVMIYRNIVFFCITLRDGDYLEEFIEKYSGTLKPGIRMDLKNFSYAQLYYMKGEYEKSLESCSKINQEFSIFKTDSKNLLLINYYELNYFESAFSMVDSYRHFLSNSKEITDVYKRDYSNFLNLYFDLLKIKAQQGKENPSFIKNKISKEKNIVNKKWLLTKADELIKKYK
ncbi:MAG: hypothetical protein ABI840_10330 [bacterium]